MRRGWLHLLIKYSISKLRYIKPGLEMPKNTEWQKQISTKRARRVSITAVIRKKPKPKKINKLYYRCMSWFLLTTLISLLIIPCFQQHVKCSLDSKAVCDAWSLKCDRHNLRKVEILPYFDIHSMDCECRRGQRSVESYRTDLIITANIFLLTSAHSNNYLILILRKKNIYILNS